MDVTDWVAVLVYQLDSDTMLFGLVGNVAQRQERHTFV